MNNTKSIVNQRRQKIQKLVEENGDVSVNELSDLLSVSVLTIRRDLQYLEEQHILERYYGGARLLADTPNTLDDSIDRAKHEIAKKAAQFVEDGDSIFINTSSTALLIIPYIQNKRVNIITNNGKSIYMAHDPLVTIVLSGGELRGPKESMTGDFAINNLQRVSANKSFLGCSGISATSGLTTVVMQEVAINELMLNRCNGSTFILADHTKIGTECNFTSGAIDKVHYLITDTQAPKEELQKIEDAGVHIIMV